MSRNRTDWDLRTLTRAEFEALPLSEVQRIQNKRSAHSLEDLVREADAELARRSPLRDWHCCKCARTTYYTREARIAGSMMASWLGLETTKYHVVVCNYCGYSELYHVLRDGSLVIDFLGS